MVANVLLEGEQEGGTELDVVQRLPLFLVQVGALLDWQVNLQVGVHAAQQFRLDHPVAVVLLQARQQEVEVMDLFYDVLQQNGVFEPFVLVLVLLDQPLNEHPEVLDDPFKLGFVLDGSYPCADLADKLKFLLLEEVVFPLSLQEFGDEFGHGCTPEEGDNDID